jgi:hypothetical protein
MLRGFLKQALRAYQLRCVELGTVTDDKPAQAEQEDRP